MKNNGSKKRNLQKCTEILNKKYKEEYVKNTRKGERKSKFSMENKMLATLEYLRKYRTYAQYIVGSAKIDREWGKLITR